MHSRNELFLRSLDCDFGVYFTRCSAAREINTKITLSWALKQFFTREHTLLCIYSINVPGRLVKWLNLITEPGSVSNEPGSVKWLATEFFKTVSWRNHTEKFITLWLQNISFWPKINIPFSYFTILMLNCLENTLKFLLTTRWQPSNSCPN